MCYKNCTHLTIFNGVESTCIDILVLVIKAAINIYNFNSCFSNA